MNDKNHEDISGLENQVKELTRSLSIRNSSTSNYASPSTASSNNSGRNVDVLLGRLHEMEERQIWMEGLISGAGGTNTELQEIRAKRLALEDRQIMLEQELQEWKRRLNNELSEPIQGKKEKVIVEHVCTQCEELKEEKVRIKYLEAELNEKIDEFELEKAIVESERCWLEKEKELLEENNGKLTVEKILLKTLRLEVEKERILNQNCKKCERIPDIEKLESTLCRNLNELADEKANIEGEKAWIDCVKREIEQSRNELNEQRKEMEILRREIECQKKVIAWEKQQMSSVSLKISNATSSPNLSRNDIDNLKQRELVLTKKSQELYELQTKLETRGKEMDLGRREMEQQWEQLLVVQNTLDTQKREVERQRKQLARTKSLTEWEKKLCMEKENLELEKMKLKREEEMLNKKQIEIESDFNLLELQMQAVSESQRPITPGRAKNRAKHRRSEIPEDNSTDDRPQSLCFNVLPRRRL